MRKQFGGKITKQWKLKYQSCKNWKEGKFQNLMDTQTAIDWKKIPGILCKQIKGHQESYPKSPLPIKKLNEQSFFMDDNPVKFIWYGHSVVLMRINNINILIDPMLGPDASPIAPTKTKRFSKNTLDIIHDLPEIDLMLITHDHYDHLDYESIQRLKNKTKNYFVSFGVKRHLVSWGIKEDLIKEFDWWDKRLFQGIEITFTPTRHFSGRGLSSLARCLWGGWAFKTNSENIWFSGDGGYGEHFLEVGNRLGPFDFAFMECGQYCEDWADIHMFPKQSVQAAIDAQVKKAMPVHWAGFNLSYAHSWYEPAQDFLNYAKKKELEVIFPHLGEIFNFHNTSLKTWWQEFQNEY